MVVQTERLAGCWTHAVASRKMFDLYVYCRPDMLWWDSLQLPSLDSIVLRAREIALAKGEHIFQQQVSIPCRTHTIFPGSIKRADEEAVPDDCFIVDDQLALVPGRFAEAFFNASSSSGRSKHCAKGDADTMKGCNAKLPIAMLPATRSTEKALTDRIQQHCIPTLIYPFNVSLCIKRPNAPNARPGGPGIRTVNPKDVEQHSMRISAYESKIKEWMIVYTHAPRELASASAESVARSRVGARTLLVYIFIADF